MMIDLDETNKEYSKGNKLWKAFFYIRNGLTLANEFKYLIAGIMALYYMMKMDNLWLMFGMFGVSLVVLFIIGWLYVHKIAKIWEWMSILYSTYWSRRGYSLQEKTVNLLEEIKEKLNG